jgi:NifU-like protein involved in Fe-S cluster formation
MAQGMNAPLYTLEILRLAATLPEPAELRCDGSSSKRSPTCGSSVRVNVQVGRDGRVEVLSQTVEACAFGQAAAALVAAGAAGRSRDEVQQALGELAAWLDGSRSDPPNWPGFEALAPARSRKSRHGAILLPLQALVAAMDQAAAR